MYRTPSIPESESKVSTLLNYSHASNPCPLCGVKAFAEVNYRILGGTAGTDSGDSCTFKTTNYWFRKNSRCTDTRPHFHARCVHCDIRFVMRAFGI